VDGYAYDEALEDCFGVLIRQDRISGRFILQAFETEDNSLDLTTILCSVISGYIAQYGGNMDYPMHGNAAFGLQ